MSYEIGAELLNFGALIAFMMVNLSAARRAWRAEKRRWFAAVLSVLGFVVCLLLWANLSRLAIVAGLAWGVLGVALYATRRGLMQTV